MGITDKIDNVTRIPESHRGTILPAPRSVKIELTGRCNYKCSFCARSEQLREQKEMDWDLFERLLIEMREAGVEEIGLFYLGESFMSKHLEKAIGLAKQVVGFPYVFLTTNGSLATPDRMEQCFINGLDSLKFSLNYSDESQFEDVARVKKTQFHKMMKNIRAAKEIRDKVENATGHRCGLYGSYILYDGNQGVRMEVMAKDMEQYLDELYGLPLYGQAGPQTSPMEDSEGLLVTGGNTGRAANPVPALPCWAIATEGHITFDGKMSACCWDHNAGLEMGDLTKDSFLDCWNSEKFQALRKAHFDGDVRGTPCHKCIYPEGAE